MTEDLSLAINLAWFLSAALFIAGLRRMSSTRNSRRGVWFAGGGMLLAVGAALGHPAVIGNLGLLLLAMSIGAVLAIFPARKVRPTNTPRMVALYNSLGGGAATGIALIGLLRVGIIEPVSQGPLPPPGPAAAALAVLAVLFGAMACSGSMLVFYRMRGTPGVQRPFANRQVAYLGNAAIVLLLGLLLAASANAHPVLLLVYVLLCLSFGVLTSLPIATADLPVLISLYNALTGLAVAIDGFVVRNPTMLIAGAIVFAAGSLLMRLMARARNRRLGDIMYSGFGFASDERRDAGPSDRVNRIDATEAAITLAYANRVIVVPGYGMAVAQAHHKLRELTQLLEERGVETIFAIHPVAGRMPGHMNVLLAEAGVPYEQIADLEDINPSFADADVALIVGADDIVNPAARARQPNALQGLVIFDADLARRVIVLKRGDGIGHSGISNPLMIAPDTRVMSGDARDSIQALIAEVKSLT